MTDGREFPGAAAWATLTLPAAGRAQAPGRTYRLGILRPAGAAPWMRRCRKCCASADTGLTLPPSLLLRADEVIE